MTALKYHQAVIIGIDDSGNFDSDRLGFFVAVYIRPKRHQKIGRLFHEWEATLPAEVKNEKGEVKGWLLDNDQLLDFVAKVLRNPIHGIRYRAHAISTSEENKQNIIKQQNRNVEQYKKAVEDYRKRGKEHFAIADTYSDLSVWLAKRSTKTLLKIKLLGLALTDSLNWAIIESTRKGFSPELAKLQFKIDQGFIGKAEHLPFWKDILRSQLWHYTYTRQSIPHIVTWNSHHPFVKKFYNQNESEGSKGVFTSEFAKSIDFYDSKDNFEIRVADVIASAIFRRDVQGQPLPAVDEIRKANLRERPYTIIQLSDNHVGIPNPYTDEVN